MQLSESKLEDISIIHEFLDIFSIDFLRLPLDKEIEFSIDLIPGTGLISKAPNQMAPIKLS